MAEQEELMNFYQNYYDKGNFELFNYKTIHQQNFEFYSKLNINEVKEKLKDVLKYKNNGNFLDVGFGLGDTLFLAHKNGFNVFGTEFDTDAIDFVSNYIPNGKFHKGDLLNSNFEENSFDFIKIWHVIEPPLYISKMSKLLKPSGIIMMGHLILVILGTLCPGLSILFCKEYLKLSMEWNIPCFSIKKPCLR